MAIPYELIDIGTTNWDTAKADAETRFFGGHQGHLVSITSAEEQAFVTSVVAPPFGAFIGGFQADNSSEPADGWTWITGELWNYTNWSSGEPNDANGTEDCAQWWTNDGWNDIHCTDRLFQFYVIEFDGQVTIPSLSQWALLALALLLGIIGLNRVQRRQA